MIATIKQDLLNDALGIAGMAISSRTTLPVLRNFLLKAEGDSLVISATDRDISVTVCVDAKVKKTGATTLPGDVLSQFVASVADDIFIEEGKGKWVVSAKKTTCKLPSIDPYEFPLLREWGDDISIVAQFPGSEIAEIASQVALAASKDENRPVLTGINIELGGGKAKFVTTDGFRLALRSDDTASQDVFGAILPTSSLKAISKAVSVFKRTPASVSIGRFKDHDAEIIAMIEPSEEHGIKRIVISSMLIDGRYPDYGGVIPKEHVQTLTADRVSLLSAVKTSLLIAKESANIVSLEIPELGKDSEDQQYSLIVSAQSAEMGDMRAEVPAEATGPIQVSVNGIFLRDSLSVMTSGKVKIGWSSPTRPITIQEDGPDDSLLHVIMPMYPPR